MEIIEPDHTTKIQAQQDADNKLPSTIDQQYFLTFFNTNNVENVTSSSFEDLTPKSLPMDNLVGKIDHSLLYFTSFISPMASLFIRRYKTNILEFDNSDNNIQNELGPEALEIPLKLISKDVGLLISTYNSLRSAYFLLKQQCDSQKKQLESILMPHSNNVDREVSIKEWEDSLQILQDEWTSLQEAVDQATWSLFVLSQRQEKSNTDLTNDLLTPPTNHFLKSSDGTYDQRQTENIFRNVEQMKIAAENEVLEKEKNFYQELNLQSENYNIEIEKKNSLFESSEKAYKSELEDKQRLISFLEQKVNTLESELNLSLNREPLSVIDAVDSKFNNSERELDTLKTSLIQEFEYRKKSMEQEAELKFSSLVNDFELKQTLLEKEFDIRKDKFESEIIENLTLQYQSKFEALTFNLESEYEAKRASLLNMEMSLENSYHQLNTREHKLIELENQLKSKELEMHENQNLSSNSKMTNDYDNSEIELQKSELKALSMHLEDLKHQLQERESQLKLLEKEKISELNSRESILTSMEAALLARTKDEEAAITTRTTAQIAISEDLKKKNSVLETDRAALETDRLTLVSLTSLLEERKSAIEGSLLAQSEAIESERSRLLAERTLFENQKRQLNSNTEEKNLPTQESISLFQIALKQLEEEKEKLHTPKLINEEKSFITQEEPVSIIKPSQRQHKGTRQYLLLSPIKSMGISSPPHLFKNPKVDIKRSSRLSQSFRRMLSRLAVSTPPSKEIKLPNGKEKENSESATSINYDAIFSHGQNSSDQLNCFEKEPEIKKSNNSYDLTSDLSSLSYVGIPEPIGGIDEQNEWNVESESTPISNSKKHFKLSTIGQHHSFHKWSTLATTLEQKISSICTNLKEERDRVIELNKTIHEMEEAKVSIERKAKEALEQANLEKEKLIQENHSNVASLKSQLKLFDDRYQQTLSELKDLELKITHKEEQYNQLLKDNQDLNTGSLILEGCSSFLLSAESDVDMKSSLFDDSDTTIPNLVRDTLSDIYPQKFASSIMEVISDDTSSWLDILQNRLNSDIKSPKEALDIFVYIVNSKISTMTQEIIKSSCFLQNDIIPLRILIAKVLRKTAHATFLFSFGIFKALQSSYPTSTSSMLNERIQVLEIALRSAEDEKKTLVRESTQNLARIAALSNELSTRSDNRSSAYWKEKCRSELDHRSDLVFQKKYLVLEITCLRSNEKLLLSLLDQLSETVPNGMLSPTPGLMSPSKAISSFSTSSFPVIARSVLACIRWMFLTRRRARLMSMALSR